MNICTVIAKNYIAHARVLAESFIEHHPEGSCTVLVIDDIDGYIDPEAEPFELVTPDDLDIEDFGHMTAFYDVLELSTAVKPWFLRYLLNEREMASVVYLDPDIRIFSSIYEIEPLMREHELVLIPHATAPMPRDGEKPSEADILIAGTYNLGFMGVHAGMRTNALLDWWSERLLTDCIVAPERGYFVDQRWLDFAHGVMPGFYVLRDATYNVAYWNLHSRELTSDRERYYVDGEPLRFFHFSGFDPEQRQALSKHQTRNKLVDNPALERICGEYADVLLAHGYEKAKNWTYTYDELLNGLRFDRFMRRLYPKAKDSGALSGSIFDPQGVREFMAWLNGPAEVGAQSAVTRYLYEIYSQRHDLRKTFPSLDGTDGRRFMQWARRHGFEQVPIPEQLLPPTPTTPNASAASPAKLRGQEEASAKVDMRSLGVNVAGYFRSELGVGEAGRQVISALDARKVPVAPVGLTAPRSRQGHEFVAFRTFEPPFPINLICVNADVLPLFVKDVGAQFFDGRYSIGFWWWEVSEFPERYNNAFHHLDEIWVGTQHVADAISRVSPIPVVKINLPVSMPPAAALGRPKLGMPKGFVFLFIFDYHSIFERKNPLATVEAFRAAFPPGSGASLVLKCINSEHHPEQHERLLLAAASHPDIHIIERYVSAQEKAAMIAECDCYVSLHRSEGFGLTLAEAMYLGKPVIATGYSGNLDYMTPHNSYLVDYRLHSIGQGADPYPPTGEWANPDVEDAARLMRHVFEHAEEARERGARAARDIRRDHSPDAAGLKMLERLRQINQDSGSQLRAGPNTVRGVASLEHGRLAKRVAAGPDMPAGSRFGAFGRFARWAAMRLIHPFVVHQREIDERVLLDIRKVNGGLQEVARRLEVQSATTHAETLAQLRRQRGQIDVLSARNETLGTEVRKLTSRLEDLYPHVASINKLMAETRALPYTAGEPFKVFEDPAVGRVQGYTTQSGDQASGVYEAFENIFRGSESFIRDRQRRYLTLLEGREPVLDAGCGRGEFLDLLREEGIAYLGLDLDPGMVELCQSKGHSRVELADVNSYLEGCEDDSLGAVFSAQVIEHLPYGELLGFLHLSLRKLRPGGLLIAETVNPHSVPAMKTFWVDLTHQHPIFPEVALALCKINGFASAFVFHPNGSGDVETDRFATGEYAVVARKEDA